MARRSFVLKSGLLNPSIRFEEDRVLLQITKCTLLFTRAEWAQAIRRGKLHKRMSQETRRQKARELKTASRPD